MSSLGFTFLVDISVKHMLRCSENYEASYNWGAFLCGSFTNSGRPEIPFWDPFCYRWSKPKVPLQGKKHWWTHGWNSCYEWSFYDLPYDPFFGASNADARAHVKKTAKNKSWSSRIFQNGTSMAVIVPKVAVRWFINQLWTGTRHTLELTSISIVIILTSSGFFSSGLRLRTEITLTFDHLKIF